MWGFVKELLDPRTSDKVRVLSKKDWPMIQTFIAPELVPKDFGGESTYTYDSASNCLGTLNWGNIEVPDHWTK